MSELVAVPVLLPLAAAALGLLAHRWPRVQAWLSVGASVGLAALAIVLVAAVRRDGVLVTQIGGWPAPHGIAFVADLLSVTMLCATSLLGLAVVIYASVSVDSRRRAFAFHPLVMVLMAGTSGVILTGDLFNLFVWLEVMLIASFVLMALGGTRPQLAGATKYVALNLLASTFLLAGIGLVYGITGTLSFADLALELAGTRPAGPVDAAALLIVAALGIKSAAFPFFFWLPASYHTPPPAVSALFAGLLTKVGVYALIRCGTAIFPAELQRAEPLLLFVAGATMLTGVLGAAAQDRLRRILSFHIVSQIGYMLMGVAIWGVRGVGGAIFFVLHNIAAKSALFLAAGTVEHEHGTDALDELGSIARERPLVAVLFLLPALALAGMPPLSGFVGKLLLVQAGVAAEHWIVTGVALLVSLLTLYSMVKMWLRAFWAPREAVSPRPRRRAVPRRMTVALGAVSLSTVALGVLGEPVVDLCLDAARQVLDREQWAATVLAAGGAR